MKKRITLFVLSILLLPVMLFASGQQEAKPAETAAEEGAPGVMRDFEYVDVRTGEKGTVQIGNFKEAPEFAALVKAGELPPVNERVPEEPLVLKPIESIGQYGGVIRNNRGAAYRFWIWKFSFEFFLTYNSPYLDTIYPNFSKAYEMSSDGKTFTFYLRKGVKWSDGEPFTADDVLYWYEDEILNDDLFPAKPGGIAPGGNLGKVTKIDDLTVRFSFDKPNPVFIGEMCRWRPPPYSPGHWAKQFHPNYVSEADIKKMMADGGFDTWSDFYQLKSASWNAFANPDRPSVSPWKASNEPTDKVFILKRNPYYWKIDIEGNQLPYIDQHEQTTVSNFDTTLLQMMGGEISHESGAYLGGRPNLPILLQNRDKGNFRIVPYIWAPNSFGSIFFNYVHEDPVVKDILNDKRFRIAISVGMNRDEMNDLLYDGEGFPSQPSTLPGAPHYGRTDEKFKRYVDHDPNLANKMLDEMGLTGRDSDGYRMRPDGKKLTLSMIYVPEHGAGVVADMAELNTKNWADIGLRVVPKPQTAALATEARSAGKFDLVLYNYAPGGRPMNMYTRGTLLPISTGWSVCPAWGAWLSTNGKQGIEPPDIVKDLRTVYEKGMIEPDEAKRNAMLDDALDIMTDNLLVVGSLIEPDSYKFFAVTKNLRNWHREGEPTSAEKYPTQPATWFSATSRVAA